VTVLFADVVGSTAMANGMEAEDTLGLLSAALRRMAAIVEAHQGRVLRFTGDGLKAAFGMDETREDDAERAVRAGLAILAAGREQAEAAARLHGITDFAVRVGVHSGDVALGAGVEDDNTAMGAAVNIAARMEQSAPPGGLRISRDTWSQVRGLFELEAQPPLQVKGIEAPMQTYLVLAALGRGAASVERGLQGLRTPMFGRQRELPRLQDTVERARQTRQLQALTLIGDAGLGKSRLLRELMAGLQDCRVMALRSQSDSQLRPWGLLRSLLALQCGVADTDSAEVAKRKVEGGLSPWFAERGERQAQLIGQLSGLDYADSPTVKGLDPRSLRDQALMALRAYLQALAAQGSSLPVLIVEDLHWADDSSLDLLQHLLAHAAELPLALVMTARPPLLTRRPEWSPPDTLITLSPLAADQGNELLHALLQRVSDVPPKLSELIVGRAEGNPYYMEELVRRLIDDGVIDATGPQWTVQADRLDTLRLPTTLVGLLQARLDALPAGERQAARQASVIGHVFWDDALQALDAQAPQALPALQRAAFVKARDSSDFEGTAERQFDHHLLHQVTYDTLLKAERKLGHGVAARWLAERTQGRGAEFLAMTGEHAERAGETALAIDCFDMAALEAQKRFASTAATAWLRRTLALLEESDPVRRFNLLMRNYDIADRVGDRAAQDAALQEGAAVLERHPDDACQAELWFSMALLADRRAETAESERLSRQAAELAERCGAAEWAAMARGNLAYLHFARQDYLGAGEQLVLALHWAGKIEPEDHRAETEAKLLAVSAMVARERCRFEEARATSMAVLSRGEALGAQRLQLGALDNLAILAATLGRWRESFDWAERMRALADSIGAAPRVAHADLHVALAAEALGDHETAMHRNQLSLHTTRVNGDRTHEVASLQHIGVLHSEQGRPADALPWFAQAQTLYGALEDAVGESVAAAHAALCQLRIGQTAEPRSTVDRVLNRLEGELSGRPAHETIELRWLCHQVLQALSDDRALHLIDQLHASVQAVAAERTDAADRDRLIQAIPTFRDIVAAWSASAAARSA
jgi:class 3 adenylate cyclase/tetratricopeptide (TPR) repeat protein